MDLAVGSNRVKAHLLRFLPGDIQFNSDDETEVGWKNTARRHWSHHDLTGHTTTSRGSSTSLLERTVLQASKLSVALCKRRSKTYLRAWFVEVGFRIGIAPGPPSAALVPRVLIAISRSSRPCTSPLTTLPRPTAWALLTFGTGATEFYLRYRKMTKVGGQVFADSFRTREHHNGFSNAIHRRIRLRKHLSLRFWTVLIPLWLPLSMLLYFTAYLSKACQNPLKRPIWLVLNLVVFHLPTVGAEG